MRFNDGRIPRGPERASDPTAPDTAERVVFEIQERLAWRIRPLIAHLPEGEIQRLLARMAWLKYKYEGTAALKWLPECPPSSMAKHTDGSADLAMDDDRNAPGS